MAADAEAARKLFSGPCVFVAGAASLDALPNSALPEIAFAGRSNVGKSSLINGLVNRSGLARTSHTPGRTRQINLFQVRDALMLADLPGYGFARVSKQEAHDWNVLITGYLRLRRNLRRVLLLVDSRRGLMESDRQVVRLLNEAAASYQIVLTKADCVKAAELDQVTRSLTKELESNPAALPGVFATSAKVLTGIPELRASLADLALG